MSDEPVVTPVVQPLGNDPSVRTPEGTIKDPALEPKTEPKQLEPAAIEPDKEPAKEPGKEPAKAEGVPEKYDFKAPEGYEIDTKVVEEATPIFKELGLNQDQAQKLFDLYSKNAIATADAAFKQYEATRTEWRNEIIKDASVGDGREGLKAEAKQNISAFMDSIGDPKITTAFKEALDLTGAGDNPAFVRALNILGAKFREGTPVRGSGPSPAGQAAPGKGAPTPATAMYPNLPSSSAR